MRKNYFYLILILLSFNFSSGQNLNSYKYVIVPNEYDFLREPNQFQLNELTKFLFNRNGMEAYLVGETIPGNLSQNRCEVLHADVINNSGLFTTKLQVKLEDCNNNEVFLSKEGRSKEKDYEKAYHEALRNAFKSIEALNYTYEGVEQPENNSNKPAPGTEKEEQVKGEVVEDLPAEVVVSGVPKTETEILKGEAINNNLYFTKGNTEFFLEETANGYKLYQKGMAEPFAALIKSTTGNNYIYSSISSQGMAHFDNSGNFVVEILNPSTNSLETTTYKVQP